MTLLHLRLLCAVQNYEWGKIGTSSGFVGQFHAIQSARSSSTKSKESEEQKMPFAELWMGTHPSGPSKVVLDGDGSSNVLLSDYIRNHPEKKILGDRFNQNQKDGNLPFLFKILSVNKALSIQSHPDKALAELLHRRDPAHYKDDNHKPEIALAIVEPFEGLCCFRNIEEIARAVHNVPELAEVIGQSDAQEFVQKVNKQGGSSSSSEDKKSLIRHVYSKLMNADAKTISTALSKLVARLRSSSNLSEQESLILRLDEQYPGGDVGCFSVYFLNHVRLNPGESLFLAPNEPHAYLHGDCVECMACSDNVVRAGLTPKFKDIQVLCDMLTYEDQILPTLLNAGQQVAPHARMYAPPVPEFQVLRVRLEHANLGHSWTFDSASILVVLEGKADISLERHGEKEHVQVVKGDVLLLFANDQVVATSTEPFLCFVAAAADSK